MSRSHSSTNSDAHADSNSRDLSRVALVDRTRRTRQRLPNAQFDEQRSMKEYIPSGIKLFDKLNTLEIAQTRTSGSMSTFAKTHTLICRVYYTFLFHIRLLQARIDAGTAQPSEIDAIHYIDERVHISSLPIHEELVETFRLSFPARRTDSIANGISPAAPLFPTFTLKCQKDGTKVVTQSLFSEQSTLQPSIRTGFHYLRWLSRNKDSFNDDTLPSISQRLNFMVFGRQVNKLNATEQNENMFNRTLQTFFANPMFRHPLPEVPGVTIESLNSLDELCIPPALMPVISTAPISNVIQNELLYGSDLTWLNHTKYIVSTLCHLTGYVAHFNEVNEPYYDEELVQATAHATSSDQLPHSQTYYDARTWMTIYQNTSEFEISRNINNDIRDYFERG